MEIRHPLATLLKAKLLESEKGDLNLTIMRIQNYLECALEIPVEIPIHPEYQANTEKVIETFRARNIHLEARSNGFIVICDQ